MILESTEKDPEKASQSKKLPKKPKSDFGKRMNCLMKVILLEYSGEKTGLEQDDGHEPRILKSEI